MAEHNINHQILRSVNAFDPSWYRHTMVAMVASHGKCLLFFRQVAMVPSCRTPFVAQVSEVSRCIARKIGTKRMRVTAIAETIQPVSTRSASESNVKLSMSDVVTVVVLMDVLSDVNFQTSDRQLRRKAADHIHHLEHRNHMRDTTSWLPARCYT